MKAKIIKALIAFIFFCQSSIAQEYLHLQNFSSSCDTVVLQTWVFFPFGFQSTCPDLSGYTTNTNIDTLTVSLYYDISGPWPFVGCSATDTIILSLSSNLTTLKGETHSIFYGDTSIVISDTTLLLCVTGFQEIYNKAGLISIEPNPIHQTLNIKMNQDLNVRNITIYNMIAQTIKQYNGVHKSIDLSDVNSGMYFLCLQTNKGIFIEKFIKD